MTTLPTVNIKGKQYVTVNERLKYFREHHAGYSLETEIVEITDDVAVMRAVIRDENSKPLATGVAREVRTDTNSFVNKTSYVENCETSAWGRALANFGIGIDETVASADEVVNAISQQDVKPKTPSLTTVLETLNSCSTQKALDVAYGQAMKYDWTKQQEESIIECKNNVSDRL